MEDAFLLAELVGDAADDVRSASHHDDLGTYIVIEVHVRGGEHRVMMIVLNVGQGSDNCRAWWS